MQLDLAMCAHWLELLFPETVTGRIGVMALVDGRPQHRSFARCDMSELLAYVDELNRAGAQGIYVRVTTVAADLEPGRRGGVDDSVELLGMWSDIDVAGPNHRPLPDGSLPLPPDTVSAIGIVTKSGLPDVSAWVHSGGGLYAFHLLDAPVDITDPKVRADVARMAEAWQAKLGEGAHVQGWHYGTGVSDLSRVLRLPGSLNRKQPEDPRLCKLLDVEGPRYSLEQLAKFVPASTGDAKILDFPTPPRMTSMLNHPAGSKTPRASTPTTDGPLSPFDDFEAKTSWSEILVGWTLDRRRSRGRTQYWIRPGKRENEGHSATTGHADDRDRMYVFSDACGLEQNTPLTKPYVYAQLHHGGDLQAAAKALREQGFGSDDWTYSSSDDLVFKPEVMTETPPWNADVPDYSGNPIDLDGVHEVFRHWLGSEYDLQALDAVLACAAVEQLDGDPVWLLVISGAGNAKTETVASLAGAGALITSTVSSEGALLSGTSKRDKSKEATGGLLRKIGDRGLLVIKDLTSVLSQNRDMRATVMAALREVFDGRWERNIGTDGGRSLEWEGRIVVVGAVTTAYDSAHSVISAMGDRFALVRLDSGSAEVRRVSGWQALRNVGKERQMRSEIHESVGRLLGSVDLTVTQLTDAEMEKVFQVANLVTRARTAIEHDYAGNPDWAHDFEMPTRFAKGISQLMRGALAIGMDRKAALDLAIRVGRDSMPPLRMVVLADVAANPGTTTTDSARRLQRPRQSVDRTLMELQLLGLLEVSVRPEMMGSGWSWHAAPWMDLDVLGCPTVSTPSAKSEDDTLTPAPDPLTFIPDTLCDCPNGGHNMHREDCAFSRAGAQ
jgi:hypothetical protein